MSISWTDLSFFEFSFSKRKVAIVSYYIGKFFAFHTYLTICICTVPFLISYMRIFFYLVYYLLAT